MKCHFKLDAGFLEQPPCAHGSCILLKLSRVKFAFANILRSQMRSRHIVLEAKEELFRRVIFVKEFLC